MRAALAIAQTGRSQQGCAPHDGIRQDVLNLGVRHRLLLLQLALLFGHALPAGRLQAETKVNSRRVSSNGNSQASTVQRMLSFQSLASPSECPSKSPEVCSDKLSFLISAVQTHLFMASMVQRMPSFPTLATRLHLYLFTVQLSGYNNPFIIWRRTLFIASTVRRMPSFSSSLLGSCFSPACSQDPTSIDQQRPQSPVICRSMRVESVAL